MHLDAIPSGEIPDVPKEQEMKEEQPAAREPNDELKIYQEEGKVWIFLLNLPLLSS